MPEMWGLDCTYSDCRHDGVTGYRLRMLVKRNELCDICGRAGTRVPDFQTPAGTVETDIWACTQCACHMCWGNKPQCVNCNGTGKVVWKRAFQSERNDCMYKQIDIVALKAQLDALGVTRDLKPEPPTNFDFFAVTDRRKLSFGDEARLVMLYREMLPRIAVYFRWDPEAGQLLTPQLITQCAFTPEMTAAERRDAPEVSLDPESCEWLVRANVGGIITSFSKIKCQHCHRPLPLRTFSTLTLRGIDKGD